VVVENLLKAPEFADATEADADELPANDGNRAGLAIFVGDGQVHEIGVDAGAEDGEEDVRREGFGRNDRERLGEEISAEETEGDVGVFKVAAVEREQDDAENTGDDEAMKGVVSDRAIAENTGRFVTAEPEAAEVGGFELIVGIDVEDEIGRERDGFVISAEEGAAVAGVFLVNDDQARLRGGELVEEFAGVVAGAVVDDDQAEVGAEEASEFVAPGGDDRDDAAFLVVGGHDEDTGERRRDAGGSGDGRGRCWHST